MPERAKQIQATWSFMNSAVTKIMKAGIRCSCSALSLFHRKGRPQNPERILLLAGGYLGDTFWAVQTVPLLKAAYPEAEIHVAGRPFLHDLAYGIVPDDRIHDVAVVSDRTRESCSLRKMRRDACALRKSVHPDLVFDLMCNRYSAWFCFHLNAYSVGMDLADEAAPLYSFCTKREMIPSVHLAYRPRSIVKQFLGQAEAPGIELVPPVPRKTKEDVFSGLELDGSKSIVLLVPGAGWDAKRWAPEKFHDLARELSGQGFQIVLSGAPDEADLCRGIADGIAGAKILCGSLSDTVSLLPHCHAVVGNDSGVVHLAAAFGIRTITLFCQTNPDFCGPLGQQSIFLRTACQHSPRGNEHFCLGGPRLTCDKPERMNFSVQQVMEKLYGK